MEINNIYETEVSPKEIFEKMKVNINDFFALTRIEELDRRYLIARPSIIPLLRKVTDKMGFKSQTYFLCIYYLDIIFSQRLPEFRINFKYYTLGLSCLSLASKYCENDPAVPHLEYFARVYNHVSGGKNKISVNDLFHGEVIACKILKYKLNYYTIYDFNSFFFGHGIIKIEQLQDVRHNYRERVIIPNIVYSKNSANLTNISYVKKILERIYKKSRRLLDIIIQNKVCLKYSSLLISIFIMKKSVEHILMKEYMKNTHKSLTNEEMREKTSKCFKEIMNEFYSINFEPIQEYQCLIRDEEFLDLLRIGKPKKFSPGKTVPDFIPNNRNLKEGREKGSFHLTHIENKNATLPVLDEAFRQRTNSIFNKFKSNNTEEKPYLNSFNLTSKNKSGFKGNNSQVDATNLFNLGLDESSIKRSSNNQGRFVEVNKDEEQASVISSTKNGRYSKIGTIKILKKLNTTSILNKSSLEYRGKDSLKTISSSPLNAEALNSNNSNLYLYNRTNNYTKDASIKPEIITSLANGNSPNEKSKVSTTKSISKNKIIINPNNNETNMKPYSKKVVQKYGNTFRNFSILSYKNLEPDINSANMSRLPEKEKIISGRSPGFNENKNNNRNGIINPKNLKKKKITNAKTKVDESSENIKVNPNKIIDNDESSNYSLAKFNLKKLKSTNILNEGLKTDLNLDNSVKNEFISHRPINTKASIHVTRNNENFKALASIFNGFDNNNECNNTASSKFENNKNGGFGKTLRATSTFSKFSYFKRQSGIKGQKYLFRNTLVKNPKDLKDRISTIDLHGNGNKTNIANYSLKTEQSKERVHTLNNLDYNSNKNISSLYQPKKNNRNLSYKKDREMEDNVSSRQTLENNDTIETKKKYYNESSLISDDNKSKKLFIKKSIMNKKEIKNGINTDNSKNDSKLFKKNFLININKKRHNQNDIKRIPQSKNPSTIVINNNININFCNK